MVQTLNFISLSSQQAPNDVDWAGLVKAGAQGALIRLGHGIIRDPCASGHIAKAKQYGLYWHGYHTYEGVVNEPQFTIKNATELGLSNSQYYFVDLTKSSDPFNDYYALHATWLSQGYSTGLLISNEDYLSKFKDSEVIASGTLRWLISDTEPADYDVWQYSSEGTVGTSSVKVGFNFAKTDKLKYNLDTTLTGADINKDPYNPETPVGGAYIGWGYDTTGLGGGKTIGYSTDGKNFYALIGPDGLIVRKNDGNRIYGTIADQIDSAISANVIPAKSAADSAVSAADAAVASAQVTSDAVTAIASATAEAKEGANEAMSRAESAWDVATGAKEAVTDFDPLLKSAQSDAKQANETATSAYEQSRSAYDAVKADSSAVVAMQSSMAGFREDVASAQSVADSAKADAGKALTQIADTASALSDAKAVLGSDVAEAKGLANTAQATANGAVESASENAKALASQANALSDAKKATDSDVASAKGLANAAQATADNAVKSASSVANDLATVSSQVKANTDGITKVTSNVGSLQTTVADTVNALSDAKTALTSDVAEVKNLASTAQTTADNAVKSASSVAGDLTAVASQAKSNAEGITKVTSDVGLLQTTVADNSGNISKIQETATQIQQAVSDNAGNITVAKQTADSAVAVASDASSNATVAIQTASQASITAQNASGQAASAVLTANGAVTTASNARSDAIVAIQTASGASLTATNAQSDATVAKQTASEANVQASNANSDFAQLSIRADKIEANVANNSGAIASVQQTANGLTTTVADIKANGGGVNLLTGTSGELQTKQFTNAYNVGPQATNGNYQIKLVKGQTYTYRVWLDNTNGPFHAFVNVRFTPIGGSNYNLGNGTPIDQGETGYSTLSFKPSSDGYALFTPFAYGSPQTFLAGWKEEMLEEGTVAHTWSPSPSDLQNQFTQIKTSIDGVTTTINNPKTGLNATYQTAAGNTTTISNVKSDVSQLSIRANKIEANVADNSGNISTIQETATQIQQAVSDNAGNITVAKQTADSAVAVASDASSNATVAIQTASQASIMANNASGQAASAVLTAQGALTTASNANSDATVAIQTASGASLTATDAKDDATIAKQTASEAKVQASNAESDFAQLSIRAGKIEASVANNSGAIASVQQTANGLTTTVGNVDNRVKTIEDKTNWTTKTGPLDMNTLTTTQNIYYRDSNLKNADGETGWAYIQVVSMGERVTQTVWHDRSSIQHTRTGAVSGSSYNWDAWNTVATNAQVVQVKQTVDGIATTINDPKTGLNATYQTAAGNATTISNVKSDVYQLQTTANGLTSRVGNLESKTNTQETAIEQNKNAITLKADQTDVDKINGTVSQLQSSLTVQADEIKNKVTQSDVTGMLTGYATQEYTQSLVTQKADDWNVNLTKLKNDTQTALTNLSIGVEGVQAQVYNSDGSSKITQLSNLIATKVSSDDFNNLSQAVNLQTLDSADINNMKTNGHYFVHNLANNPIGGWVYVDVTGNGNDRIRQDVYQDTDNQHCYRRLNGSEWTDWSKSATESEITQLSDDINLRVKSADLISQINLQAGTALIQSNKLVLDAGTTVFTGDAFIPSAAISSISADKIMLGSTSLYNSDGTLNLVNKNDGTTSKITVSQGNVNFDGVNKNASIIKFASDNNTNAFTVNPTGATVTPTLFFERFDQTVGHWLGFTRNEVENEGVTFHTWDDDGQRFFVSCHARFDKNLSTLGTFSQGSWDGTTAKPEAGVLTIKSGNTIWSGSDFLAIGSNVTNTYTGVWAKAFVQQSTLSSKTNIETVDPKDALDLVNKTDIRSYQYKSDVEQGKTKRYTSLIIDDVNDVSQYYAPDEFTSEERNGRDDGSAVGYLFLAVKELTRRIKTLEDKLNG